MNLEKQRQEFRAKKTKILSDLASGQPDASPKGSVDTHILPLIDLLNQHDEIVTTSSCSGRISVFLEGRKEASGALQDQEGEEELDNVAAIGGKGGGGKWLLVTHDPLSDNLDADDSTFLEFIFGGIPSQPGPERLPAQSSKEIRYIHFKFEPMILHVLTADLEIANGLLISATASSFRESGIVNPLKTPVVAIRTTGLAFDAPIGVFDPATGTITRLAEPPALRTLVRLANDRFQENFRRIESLRAHVVSTLAAPTATTESKQERANRKRLEGLERQKNKPATTDTPHARIDDPLDGGISF
ncbi:tRNA wybutosine-synthesizing protein [Drechslerella dactyloides]|uniref:tRNA wybutosine-synthesizing protein 3 n=1 Tax=Drechslerella dactyloides TaxID=74499 RepID=A0AAD6J0C9_DREDA|nr:tRNA wybutosine-synthesizing protein [Drechslerella dactyloides]